MSANDLTGPQKRDISLLVLDKGQELIKEELYKIVPNCINDGGIKESSTNKNLLAAEVSESRDADGVKKGESNSGVMVGKKPQAQPNLVKTKKTQNNQSNLTKPKKTQNNQRAQQQKRKNQGNMRRQFQKGQLVRFQGKTYRIVEVMDQPMSNIQKRRQFQRRQNQLRQQASVKAKDQSQASIQKRRQLQRQQNKRKQQNQRRQQNKLKQQEAAKKLNSQQMRTTVADNVKTK